MRVTQASKPVMGRRVGQPTVISVITEGSGAIEHIGFRVFSIGVGDGIFHEICIFAFVAKNSHPHYFVSRTKSNAKKIEIGQYTFENSPGETAPRGNYI